MAMNAARAGVEIMVKTIATGLKRSEEGIIVSAECMDQSFDIHTKIVIAADGPESRVGRWAGLKTTLKPKIWNLAHSLRWLEWKWMILTL